MVIKKYDFYGQYSYRKYGALDHRGKILKYVEYVVLVVTIL